MSITIYESIFNAKKIKQKLLAILIDPDKVELAAFHLLIKKINKSPATHIFIGGSVVQNFIIDELIIELRKECKLPILIFPGHPSQISHKADGILFLSLLSGRNPEFLIEHHINAIDLLEKSKLEIIPTGYILINGGKQTAVERVSKTTPIARNNINLAYKTAKAGEYLGCKLIYLEAGSGALEKVPIEMIQQISQNLAIPIIVGGGIRTKKSIQESYQAGADMIVIGTAFENDPNFFD
ncbi:geranylgeranylglyceryl/heptaprenylglyceryl phosphate synthase [Flavobacterium oreochromis]|uniref:Geranylgeranylglyceryl phosphate synthase n=2 Tax=Flavobacterium TaxID=237 RepID=A0A246GCF0_9FLAO|nr:geranylgeranylglyceryl/heptaprenylglyceryl phosphate synthase [Flavobacterium oreochromis]OWP78175.1 geranylgeranylglyceryl/heptaprenylglyceryl phosphate synthase [Flavobacterium oreochromis]OWP78816.1 geranylgeranylglyceryl/heptaprenylglyceryl phosphate synthase [Flavobacterium oreochromis]POR24997.1 geranylgeranylglyceryl/heptaprenylglyceryl phosphate synthase [Flavobacterium columnare]QYS87531.1 geranylgeranylglyceryl/heptaprenylglyceryl phosphate synthase [Flavobacterium oreochromis]